MGCGSRPHRSSSADAPLGPTAAHSTAATFFAASLCQALSAGAYTDAAAKRCAALLVATVSAVSTTLYASKAAGFTLLLPSRVPGRPVAVLRYLQWAFTTACFIRLLAGLSPDGPATRALVRRTLLATVLLLAAGAAERLLPAPAAYAALAVSMGSFGQALQGQVLLFRLGARTLSLHTDRVALASLQRATVATWALFPAGWALAEARVLGVRGEEVYFTALDVCTKFGYATFVLVAAFSFANKG